MSAGSVDEVVDLYQRWGDDPYDEEITQTEHAVQTAALAVAAGAPEPLVAAALLHDVGHLLDLAAGADRPSPGTPDRGHESTGARYLAGLFPASVTGPIALHVRAKRYRCAVDADYGHALSAGSRRSLAVQGGPMTDIEVTTFEANPAFADTVALRGWDDGGKVEGLVVEPFDAYRSLLDRLAGRAGSA